MVQAPWSPAYKKAWGGTQDAQGFEAQRLRIWNVSDTITVSMGIGTGTGNVPDGILAFRTTTSQRRLNFTDAGADVIVPRVDYNETVSGQWSFTYNSGAPFTVTSSTKVTNLNADLLDGYNTSESETASTVAVRNSSGRLKCADPVSGTDVVNYQSMTAYVSGAITPKVACKYATTASLDSYTPSGTPKVLTANANGVLSVDGNTPSVNDRIGVVYETGSNEKYNGIYIVTAVGVAGGGGSPWVLTRATDSDTSAEMPSGTQFWVTSGTDNGGSSWLLTTPDPITLDTTALTFVQNGGIANIIAGNGIDKTGNTLSVKINASTTYTQGAIVYANSTTTLSAAQLTGIIKGNGTSAPTAVTGTNNVLTKWGTAGETLTTSTITDDGTSVSVAANLNPSADSTRNFGTTSLAWLTIVGDVHTSTAGTGSSFTAHNTLYSTHTCWAWGLKGIESGSNAGSNLVLTSYTDAGTAATEVITITRSTGAISFSSTITATGATFSGLTSGKLIKATSGGQLADSIVTESGSTITVGGSVTATTYKSTIGTSVSGTHHYELANGADRRFGIGLIAAESGSNVGSDFAIWRYDDSEAFSGTVLLASRSSGHVGIGVTPTLGRLHVGTSVIDAIYGTTSHSTSYGGNFHNTNGGGDRYVLVGGPIYSLLAMAGNIGFGTLTPAAMLHVLKTSEQLRLAYDGTYYTSVNVASAGLTTVTSSAGLTLVTGGNANIALTPNGTGDVTSSGRVHITKTTEQLRIAYDSTNYVAATVDSTSQVTWAVPALAKTATYVAHTISSGATSSASSQLTTLKVVSNGVSNGASIGLEVTCLNSGNNTAGIFRAYTGSGSLSTGVQGQAEKTSSGSETILVASEGYIVFTASASSTTGTCFKATGFGGTNFSSLVGFSFTPSFSSTPTGTSVYAANLSSVISGATVATNYSAYLNATGGTLNYALWVENGSVRFNTLTASRLLQLNGDKDLIASNDLPSATTINGKVIARKASGSITWSLSGSEYICDITHGLGTDEVTVEVYDGSANKSTWLFEIRRPSSGVVRVVADVNFGTGYTYVIIG